MQYKEKKEEIQKVHIAFNAGYDEKNVRTLCMTSLLHIELCSCRTVQLPMLTLVPSKNPYNGNVDLDHGAVE